MKSFLKGLLAFVLGLLALGCLGLTLCIFDPDMARAASDLLTNTPLGSILGTESDPALNTASKDSVSASGDGTIHLDTTAPEPASPDKEIAASDPSASAGMDKHASSKASDPAAEDQHTSPETGKTGESALNSPSRTRLSPSSKEAGGAYVPPAPQDIAPPDKVSGKTGYQPIQEQQEQVPDEAAKEMESALDVGKTGDGLTFDATLYPYYQMLDDGGKHLYRQIYANATSLNQTFAPIESIHSRSRLKEIFSAVYNDHPELFWLDTSYACKALSNGKILEINLSFNKTAKDLDYYKEEFAAAADKLLRTARTLGSDYEKEKYLHNALVEQISYMTGAPMNQSAYSGLVSGRTVCAGYSRAFQYLLMELGIPCYYCTGYAGEDHAWNIVKLEDGYYNVDVTWDDTEGGLYDFFNKTDNDYASSHARQDLSIYLPPCEGSNYRNLERDEQALESLKKAGFRPEDILYDIHSYYQDCANQILRQGKGNYDFSNVVRGEALAGELLNQYTNGNYENGYMNRVMTQLGATECNISLTAESLPGGNYKLTHRVAMR